MFITLTQDVTIAEIDPFGQQNDPIRFKRGVPYEVLYQFETEEVLSSNLAYVIFDGFETVTVASTITKEVE